MAPFYPSPRLPFPSSSTTEKMIVSTEIVKGKTNTTEGMMISIV